MHYKKLEVWKLSFQIAVEVKRLTENCRDFGFCDQIRRSAVSVPSNIAEGEERETVNESVRFLYIAKGSCGELVTQILLAKEFGYLSSEQSDYLECKAIRVSKMLAGLIKSRKGTVREERAEYVAN